MVREGKIEMWERETERKRRKGGNNEYRVKFEKVIVKYMKNHIR